MRLGCFKKCLEVIKTLKEVYYPLLGPHLTFMNKYLGSKQEHCEHEFADNSKIYFESVVDPSLIPPLNPSAFCPQLEYAMPGYMAMINAPIHVPT